MGWDNGITEAFFLFVILPLLAIIVILVIKASFFDPEKEFFDSRFKQFFDPERTTFDQIREWIKRKRKD